MIDYNTCLQTVSAISSAIAAIIAGYIAWNNFNLQKNLLINKGLIELIVKLLHQFHYLKSLTGQNVLAISDKEINDLPQKISEINRGVVVLNSMVSSHANFEVKTILDIVTHLHEENLFALAKNTANSDLSQRLDDAIRSLQKIYHFEIK